MMLDDLGNPPARKVARHLGVSTRTVQRWFLAGAAPRPVLLALFWSTRWGRSVIDCRAVNDARMQASIAAATKRENEALRRELARVVALGDFDSANAPLWRVLPARLAKA